jgi:hypothetical protein
MKLSSWLAGFKLYNVLASGLDLSPTAYLNSLSTHRITTSQVPVHGGSAAFLLGATKRAFLLFKVQHNHI